MWSKKYYHIWYRKWRREKGRLEVWMIKCLSSVLRSARRAKAQKSVEPRRKAQKSLEPKLAPFVGKANNLFNNFVVLIFCKKKFKTYYLLSQKDKLVIIVKIKALGKNKKGTKEESNFLVPGSLFRFSKCNIPYINNYFKIEKGVSMTRRWEGQEKT